jgi:hypothetical protein
MRKFEDTHKNRITPSVIIRRADVPDHFQTSEVAGSFRDVLVASVVPLARSRDILYANRRGRISYSSFFRPFPWMLDKNFEWILASTPQMLALHEIDSFRGHSSPDLSPSTLLRSDFDEPLLETLLARLNARYEIPEPRWEDVALFRSLNMAYHASQFPGGTDATIHDFGRIIALWVSSFEILAHPGPTGNSNLERVSSLLDKIPWVDTRCGHRRLNTTKQTRKGPKIVRRNLASWNYSNLYDCRNKFLHGSPVKDVDLQIRDSRRLLNSIAPPLYRLALTAFLPLIWEEEIPPIDDPELFGDFIARNSEFEAPQRDAEHALKLSRISERQQERLNETRIQDARARNEQIRNNT